MDVNRIVVLGATGSIGREIMSSMSEANIDIDIDRIIGLSTPRSVDHEIAYGDRRILAKSYRGFVFQKGDIVLSALRSDIIAKLASSIISTGAILIDSSSYFRQEKDVPLVIPEVNPEALSVFPKNIISSPNCVVSPLLVALKPLHKEFKIKRIVMSTYQAVSGAGKDGITELYKQTKKMFEASSLEPSVFMKRIAFNCIPKIGEFNDEMNTGEEDKVVKEIKKVLDEAIEVSATCVRVPVFTSHSESINIEFEKDYELNKVKSLLSSVPLIELPEDEEDYVTPIDAAARNEIFISRVRRDKSIKNGLNFWLVADNVRKGGGLNMVHILQHLLKAN